MTFFSLEFVLFVLAAVTAINLSPSAALRAWLFLGFSLYFLATMIGAVQNFVALAAFLLVGYAFCRLLASPAGRARLPYLLIIIVLAFIELKRYDILKYIFPAGSTLAYHTLAIVGISYMLFRQVHLMVEISSGTFAPPPFVHYLNYMIGFPSLLAGPIQRYADYNPSMDPAASVQPSDTLGALHRIANGAIKKFLIANWLVDYSITWVWPVDLVSTWRVWAGVYIYTFYLYFDFSGYTDMAIGIARLCGVRLPENFDNPLLARNLLTFWNKWHISLTEWLKDYVFTPVATWVGRATDGQKPVLCGVTAYFVTFLIMALWHASTLNFLIYGIVQGLGLAACKLWGVYVRRRMSKEEYMRYMSNPWIGAVGTVLTFHFFALTLVFVQPMERVGPIFCKLFGLS